MNAATLPCPTCACTGEDTHEDRHAGTRMDICRTCGGERFIQARTGETPEASFQPVPKPTGTEAGRGVGAETRYQYREIGEGDDWQDCSKATYDSFQSDPHIDTREIAATPTPPTPDSTGQGDGTRQEGGR